MTSDQKLRRDRMVFYARDIERIEGELDGFLELSGARSALLIDRDGHLVTRRGESIQGSLESVSALVAGSFAATREMARQLGEEEFATLFHQGQRDSIQVSLVGDRALFATVFDERTNLGLVRFYAQETTRRMEEVLAEIDGRESDGEEEGLAADFSSSAAAALDRIL
jgi:predicted regulator of Ras-like GTPase activity (Roadblock/LC7/MglB family)